MTNVSDILLETINYAIEKRLANASFDRTLVCTVKNIATNGRTLTLAYGNEEYVITTKHILSVNLMDKLHLVIPCNNTVSKYVIEDVEWTNEKMSILIDCLKEIIPIAKRSATSDELKKLENLEYTINKL